MASSKKKKSRAEPKKKKKDVTKQPETPEGRQEEHMSPFGLGAFSAFVLLLTMVLPYIANPSRQLTASRQFLSHHSQVYVIPNFLPDKTAFAWRRQMQQLWNQTLDKLEQDGEDTCVASGNNTCPPFLDGFILATNNNGKLDENNNNAKTRSLANLDERRAVAQELHNHKYFAYSKWELDPSHPLIAEMQQTLTEPALLESVDRIIQKDYPQAKLDSSKEMSDIFVTHYAKGDFLSPHNDGNSGSWAVVISLVEDNYDASIDGGGLQFQCPRLEGSENSHKLEYCETLHPKFNTAVVFATRLVDERGRVQMGPTHQVMDVVREQGGRYAITGWWMDVRDAMTGNFKVERDKARGRK